MKFITFNKNDIKVDIKFSLEENTVWMSQNDMATLFKRNVKTVFHHVSNVLSKYTDKCSVISRNENTGPDGKVYEINYYNLDVIKQVGYKINPTFTNEFVSWCNAQLNSLNHQNMSIQSNIIRFNNGLVELDVTIEPVENTVYLDKEQLMILFDATRQNISLHIRNIVSDNELADDSVHKEYLYTALQSF